MPPRCASRRLFTRASRTTGCRHASNFVSPVASEVEVQSARAHCLTLLRKFDSPSFTLQTFIPSHVRDAYLSIRAFNIDVSRVADATSNPIVGAMRLQFWRDVITSSLAGTPKKEPVAILLAHAAKTLFDRTNGRGRLSQTWFYRIISEREKYLENPPYPTMDSLDRYAENTYSTLLYLILSALPLTSITADHLASHIGKATGISAVLRGLPLLAFPLPPNHHSNQAGLGGNISSVRQGFVSLPLEIMATCGVKEEEVLRQGAEAPGLRDAVFTVATRANDHLITAREMLKQIKAGQGVGHEFEHESQNSESREYNPEQENSGEDVERAFGVLMPAISTQMWLDRLQKVDFNIFDPSLRRTDWRLPWKSYWAYQRRQI